MGNSCKAGLGRDFENELQVEAAKAKKAEDKNRQLIEKLKSLQRQEQEFETRSQEFINSIEQAAAARDAAEAAVEEERMRAEARVADVEEDTLRLKDRIAELEEEKMQARALHQKVAELEEENERQAQARAPLGRDLAALRADRRVWEEEKELLERSLAESRQQLESAEETMQRLEEERAEAQQQALRQQHGNPQSPYAPADTGAGAEQAEDHVTEALTLRSENEILREQCKNFAAMAEQMCARAEQARVKFERAEQMALGRGTPLPPAAVAAARASARPPASTGDAREAPELASAEARKSLASAAAALANLRPASLTPGEPTSGLSTPGASIAGSTVFSQASVPQPSLRQTPLLSAPVPQTSMPQPQPPAPQQHLEGAASLSPVRRPVSPVQRSRSLVGPRAAATWPEQVPLLGARPEQAPARPQWQAKVVTSAPPARPRTPQRTSPALTTAPPAQSRTPQRTSPVKVVQGGSVFVKQGCPPQAVTHTWPG